mmetsp:Transcript_16227/g.35508  ORF Transcript_16227/g.35508 Transcript_16227/m.35508 type:complete len:239 (-) Transcript_16227:939-1655(-)
MVGPKLTASVTVGHRSIISPTSRPACMARIWGVSEVTEARWRINRSTRCDEGAGAHPGYAGSRTSVPPAKWATAWILSRTVSNASPREDLVDMTTRTPCVEVCTEATLLDVSTRPSTAWDIFNGPWGRVRIAERMRVVSAAEKHWVVAAGTFWRMRASTVSCFSSSPYSSRKALARRTTLALAASTASSGRAKVTSASRGIALRLSPPSSRTSLASDVMFRMSQLAMVASKMAFPRPS